MTAADKTRRCGIARIPSMQDAQPEIQDEHIRDVDALARAAFTWVRQQTMEQRFLGQPVTEPEQNAMAAGFLAGLRTTLSIGDRESVLVAYAYSLMQGERSTALNSARNLVGRAPGMGASCAGFLHGIQAARHILADTVQPAESGSELKDAPYWRN